jgi:hypothetical protein
MTKVVLCQGWKEVERMNSKRKEGLKRRKNDDLNNKKTDAIEFNK